MEPTTTENAGFIRSGRRKFTKISALLNSGRSSAKKHKDLAEELRKIYAVSRSHNRSLARPKPVSDVRQSIDLVLVPPQNALNLPNIYPKSTLQTRRKLSLKGKEDHLDQMINTFIDEHSARGPRPDINAVIFSQAYKKPSPEKIYEKNLQEIRGPEMKAYQEDIEKNLIVEKIRLKSYKRYRQKLLSV
jgi:hypothetical protein